MNEDILIPLMFFVTVIVLALGIPLVRAHIRQKDRTALPTPLTPELAVRLDRLESTIETVAIEVERMAEGQRFTTRLLAEGAALPLSQPARDAATSRVGQNGGNHG
jgi:hypothetical protein